MSNVSIKITGFSERAPQILPEGDIAIIFKAVQTKSAANNQQTFETFIKVLIKKNVWQTVADEIGETTYYIIEGIPKASISSKKTPFTSVICSSIKVVNGVEKDNEESQYNSLSEDTDEIIAISAITVDKKQIVSSKAKKDALNFYKKYGTFKNAIVVDKETMTLVSGYENYLVCEDLGIDTIPVCYDLVVGPEAKDEELIKNIVWYTPEEIIKVELKDIILTEDAHLNVQNFVFRINLKQYSETGKITVPIAIRPLGEGKYSLVTGAARYFAAKILNISRIPAVITDMGHDEFVKNKFAQVNKANKESIKY